MEGIYPCCPRKRDWLFDLPDLFQTNYYQEVLESNLTPSCCNISPVSAQFLLAPEACWPGLAWQVGRVPGRLRAFSWLLSQPEHCSDNCLLRWHESKGELCQQKPAGEEGSEREENGQEDVEGQESHPLTSF